MDDYDSFLYIVWIFATKIQNRMFPVLQIWNGFIAIQNHMFPVFQNGFVAIQNWMFPVFQNWNALVAIQNWDVPCLPKLEWPSKISFVVIQNWMSLVILQISGEIIYVQEKTTIQVLINSLMYALTGI